LSLSEDLPERKVVIDTRTPATEITVLDWTGKVCAKAVRRVELSLAPALYKIRYRIGNRIEDQLIEISPGEDNFEVPVPSLPILSAAPLADSEATDEAASARFAQELVIRHSTDTKSRTSLFIFIAAIADSATNPADLPQKPGAGVSVHTFSGEKIGDLEDAETQMGCCGWTLAVEPGNYILRVEMPPGRPVEQTLVAVEGWQLQFYTRIVKSQTPLTTSLTENSTPGASSTSDPQFAWQLDLGRSGVLLVKDSTYGIQDPDQMKWTAAARQALAAGRSGAAPDKEMLDSLLHGKFDNPMLGIYAGHLLAMQENPNLALLREVVDNLTSLLGDHPDVTALLIPLKDPRAGSVQYSEPPMLRRSWAMIVSASTPEKDLRPPQSYAARIGGSLWGSSAWLAWRMPTESPATSVSLDVLPALMAQIVSGKLTDSIRRLMDSEEAAQLTPVEALLARYLDLASNQFQVAKKFSVEGDRKSMLRPIYPLIRSIVDSELLSDTKKGFTSANIMKLTGLPYSAIVQAAASLATKLGVNPTQSILSQVFGALRR
jgi:hypothetical protein